MYHLLKIVHILKKKNLIRQCIEIYLLYYKIVFWKRYTINKETYGFDNLILFIEN